MARVKLRIAGPLRRAAPVRVDVARPIVPEHIRRGSAMHATAVIAIAHKCVTVRGMGFDVSRIRYYTGISFEIQAGTSRCGKLASID